MRLLALLPAALLLSPFAAAQDSLRAEIRKIVREEIRAAMQELHGAPATKTGEGQQGRDVAKVRTVFGKMVDGKPVEGMPIEVRIADQTAKWEEVPAHSFQWVTDEKADAAGGKVLHIFGDKPVEARTKGLKVQNVQGQPIEVEGHEFFFHPGAGNQQIKIVKAKADAAPTECKVECQVECTTDTKQATSSCCEAAKATSECCEGEKCEECVVEVKAAKATKKQKQEGGKKKSKKAKPAQKVEEFELKIG